MKSLAQGVLVFRAVFFLLALNGFEESLQAQRIDLFENARMPEGSPFEGQLLETSERRSIVILNDTAAADFYGLDPGSILIANFQHIDADGERRFYIARIPRGAVKRVYFLVEKFAPFLAHAMMRFEFLENEPVELLALQGTEEDFNRGVFRPALETPIQLSNVIMTADATYTRDWVESGRDYDTKAGTEAKFANSIRFVSVAAKGQQAILEAGHSVKQYPLDRLSLPERSDVLDELLKTSHEQGMSGIYHLLFDNCNTVPMRCLRRAVKVFEPGDTWLNKLVIDVPEYVFDRILYVSQRWPALVHFGLIFRGYRWPFHYSKRLEKDPIFLRWRGEDNKILQYPRSLEAASQVASLEALSKACEQ